MFWTLLIYVIYVHEYNSIETKLPPDNNCNLCKQKFVLDTTVWSASQAGKEKKNYTVSKLLSIQATIIASGKKRIKRGPARSRHTLKQVFSTSTERAGGPNICCSWQIYSNHHFYIITRFMCYLFVTLMRDQFVVCNARSLFPIFHVKT